MTSDFLKHGESKYRSSTFCCRSYVNDKSKPLVITFHYAQNIPTKVSFDKGEDSIFSFEFLKKNNINVISIAPLEKNSWYRDSSLWLFLNSITSEINNFPLRVGFGSSMGGYAVATFSELLNFDRILLLNPISTLSKVKAPFERRFKCEESNWQGQYSDAAQTKCPGVIIYDPLCHEDRMHAKRFKENIELIPLFGAGHNTPRLLSDMGELKNLVLTFIQKGELSLNLKKRRECQLYYQNLLKSKRLTNSRAKIINGHYNNLIYKREFKYITNFTNKEIYNLEQAAIKLSESEEFGSAIDIIEHLIKLKPASKRYKSLYETWKSLS